MTVIKTGLAVLLAVVVAVAIISTLYQALADRRAGDKYPPPGVMVDVGGYRLHFNCAGKGDTTVILEAGGGTFSLSWALVQTAAAQAAGVRVCSYDRAGLGWSDPRPGPYSVTEEIEALHQGLITLGIARNLVLVGHSYGGFLASLYAGRYPKDVIGLALVDPNSAFFFDQYPSVVKTVQRRGRLLRIAAPIGVVRWIAAREMQTTLRLAHDNDARKLLDLSLTTKQLSSTAKMLLAFSRTLDAVRTSGALPDVPLTIITRGKAEKAFPWGDAEKENTWRRGQERTVRAAPQGKLIVAAESGHMVPFDQPELIVDAITHVISTAGNRSR